MVVLLDVSEVVGVLRGVVGVVETEMTAVLQARDVAAVPFGSLMLLRMMIVAVVLILSLG